MDVSTDRNFEGGAVRSADADGMDFCSLPILGLMGVARTAHEGGTKYGRHNYMLGMPTHECLNHAIRHIYMFLAGDRSEPHLEHATWNLMTAVQSFNLDPEMNAPHLLEPGMRVGEAMRTLLSTEKEMRAEARRNGDYDYLAGWCLSELPEVEMILLARDAGAAISGPLAARRLAAEGVPADQPLPPASAEENAQRIAYHYGGMKFSAENAFELIDRGVWMRCAGTCVRNKPVSETRPEYMDSRGEYRAYGSYPDNVRSAPTYTLGTIRDDSDSGWQICLDGNDFETVWNAVNSLD